MTEEVKKEESKEVRSLPGERYTSEELMVRLKFIIGCCLAATLIGIVFVVLYSIIFVTQPLNAISPIDQKFFELIIPVATFLCGTLSGIMLAGSGKEAAMAGVAAQQMAQGSFGKPVTNPSAMGLPQHSWQQPHMQRPGMMPGGMMNAMHQPPSRFNNMATGMAAGAMMGAGMAMASDMFEPGQSPKFTDDDY